MNSPTWPQLNEKWLKCFLAIGETLNLPAAARRQGISLRTLGRYVQALETTLGVRLLIPQGRDQVLLSTEGLALLQRVSPLCAGLDALANGFWLEQPEGLRRLSVGWCSPWPLALLPRLLDRLEPESGQFYPRICRMNWAEDVEQALLKGEIDLGLSCREPRQRSLAWLAGVPSEYAIVGRPQDPRPWQDWPYVAGFRAGAGSLHGPWDDRRYPRQIRMRAEGLSPVLDLASTGQVVAWLPMCLVAGLIRNQQLAILAEPPRPQQLVPYLLWRKDRELPTLVRQALQVLTRLLESDFSR